MYSTEETSKVVRVLHVIDRMDRGGAETMIMNLYRRIDKDKLQFDFLVHSTEKGMYDDEILFLGGRIFSITRFNGYNGIHYYREAYQFFKSHKEYNIVHGHIGSCAAFYLKAAKKNGCFTIAHSHNASTEKTFRNFVFNVFSYPTRFIADQLIGCSQIAGESRFGKRLAISDRYFNFYNAIDVKDFLFSRERKNAFKKSVDFLPDDSHIYGTVGRLTYQKNPRKIFDIFKSIIKIDEKALCLWIGNGEFFDEINSMILSEKLDKRIFLLGIQNNVKDWLQIMDCFVFPSFWEGLPVTLVEAQAAGLPCIISDAITTEVDITELVTRLSIEQDSIIWANLAYSKVVEFLDVRNSDYEKIKTSGYEIADTADWLSNYYMRIAASKNITLE